MWLHSYTTLIPSGYKFRSYWYRVIPAHSATFRRLFKKQMKPAGQQTTVCLNFLKIIRFEPRLLETFCKVFFRTTSHGLIWSIMSFILSRPKNLQHINFCNPLTRSGSEGILQYVSFQNHKTLEIGSNTGCKNIYSLPRQQFEYCIILNN